MVYNAQKYVFLLSIISEKTILTAVRKNKEPKIPELKSDELVMIASLENRHLIIQMLVRNGLKKNKHWILFL